jgi:hypothetical protein
MKNFAAVTFACLIASTAAAPTPKASLGDLVLGSITNPEAGNDNDLKTNGNGNGAFPLLPISHTFVSNLTTWYR